jgi:hypothetical protein
MDEIFNPHGKNILSMCMNFFDNMAIIFLKIFLVAQIMKFISSQLMFTRLRVNDVEGY